MSEINVVESILEAMEIVSNKSLKGISFDKTIECEIVDASDAKNGRYKVSDGSIKFEAYSEKNSYKNGNKVLVKIPQGDFSGSKYIEGLAEKQDGEPITYLSALNTMMDVVELTKKTPINYQNENEGIGLIANSNVLKELIWSFDFTLPENQNIWLPDIYSSLYIEVDFKTNLNNVKKGTYGLFFEVIIKLANGNLLSQYYNINSTEFFGNPYGFLIPTNQSKKFDIKNTRRFEKINLYFSQGADFYDSRNEIYPIANKSNIFVKNIRVGLGTNLSEIADNSLKLITLDSSTYGTKDSSYSSLTGLDYFWYNKSEDNKYLGFSDGLAEIVITDEQVIEYEDCDYCGMQCDGNVLNTSTYDEEAYNLLVAEDLKLKNQKNENTPPDIDSLNIMANLQEKHQALSNIVTLIDKDYTNLLFTLKNNMPVDFSNFKWYTGKDNSTGMFDINTSELKKYLNNTFKKENSDNNFISFLVFYKNIFKYISSVYKSLKNNLPDETKEVERKIPEDWVDISNGPFILSANWIDTVGNSDNQNNLDNDGTNDYYKIFDAKELQKYLNIINTLLSEDFQLKLENDYSTHIRYYNNFKIKMAEVFDKLKMYCEELITFDKDDDHNFVVKTCLLPEVTILETTKNNTEFEKLYTFQIGEKLYDNDYYLKEDNNLKVEEWIAPTYEIFNNLYCIYWYRFEEGYIDETDPFGTTNWKRIKNENLFTVYNKINNDEEYIFNGENPYNRSLINLGLPSKTIEVDGKKYWDVENKEDNKASLSVVLNPQKTIEKFKVVLFYNHEKFESNEIEFNNIYHPNTKNVIENEVIEILHSLNSQDSYPLYSASSKHLLNSNEAYIERKIKAGYDLKEGESGYIHWYFPTSDTQLDFPKGLLKDFIVKSVYKLARETRLYVKEIDKDTQEVLFKLATDENKNNIILKDFTREFSTEEEQEDGYYKFDSSSNLWIRVCDLQLEYASDERGYACAYKKIEAGTADLTFPYKIKDSFDRDNNKNIIFCEILLENGSFKSGNKGFSFLPNGSNGTNYTLIVSPVNPIEKAVKNGASLLLKAEVRDKEANLIPIEELSAMWATVNGKTKEDGATTRASYGCNINGDIIEVFNNTNGEKCGVLKIVASIKNNNVIIKLDTLYAIPWSEMGKSYDLDGPTGVTYGSQGTLLGYSKTPYQLMKYQDLKWIKEDDITIEISYLDTNLEEYNQKNFPENYQNITNWMPKLGTGVETNVLIAPTLYMEDIGLYPRIIVKNSNGNIIFVQPLTIEQDSFESNYINQWDGELIVDKDNNIIMSAMVGAGIKDTYNSFSGVLMGNVKSKAGYGHTGIGLYGFHQGGQSFGFNVDGTAFLGKSGSGRIEFDGNTSTIKSAFWDGEINNTGTFTKLGTTGMAISLNSGSIDAHDFTLTSGQTLLLQSNPVPGEDYFHINGSTGTKIQFTKEGALNLVVSSFKLTSNASVDDRILEVNDLNRKLIVDKLSLMKNDGIYLGGDDGLLFINATAIKTGWLQSDNENMLINMDSGHISSKYFCLEGGNKIYFNSSPELETENNRKYYMKLLTDGDNGSYLKFALDGSLQINLKGVSSYLKAEYFDLDVQTEISSNTNVNLDYWKNSAKIKRINAQGQEEEQPYRSLEFRIEAQVCLEIATEVLDPKYSTVYTSGGWSFIGESWRRYLSGVQNNPGNYSYSINLWQNILGETETLTNLIDENNSITATGWKFLKLTVYNIENKKEKKVSSEDARAILRIGSNLETGSLTKLGLTFNPDGFEIYKSQENIKVDWDASFNNFTETVFSANAYGVSGIFNNLIFRGTGLIGTSLPEESLVVTSDGTTRTIQLQDGTVFFLLE